jgi:hypothetical protein
MYDIAGVYRATNTCISGSTHGRYCQETSWRRAYFLDEFLVLVVHNDHPVVAIGALSYDLSIRPDSKSICRMCKFKVCKKYIPERSQIGPGGLRESLRVQASQIPQGRIRQCRLRLYSIIRVSAKIPGSFWREKLEENGGKSEYNHKESNKTHHKSVAVTD